MVLLLKQWKSRSSPGFETGVSKNPFTISEKPLPALPSGGFFVPGRGPEAAVLRKAEWPPGPPRGGRIAKLADASAGA